MSDGQHGHGVTLSATTVGTVGNVISVSVDGQTRDPVEISSMDSDSKFREFIAGMADPGEITVEVNYDGSAAGVADKLDISYQAGTILTWTITFTGINTFVCNGIITSLGIATPFDDKITQSITVKLTAIPTFTDLA